MYLQGNSKTTSSDLEQAGIQQGMAVLRQRLPEGWSVDLLEQEWKRATRKEAVDGVLRIIAPDQTSAEVQVEVNASLDPQKVLLLAHRIQAQSVEGMDVIVMAPYLSPSTRETLQKVGMGYLDFTGNARITLARPGLYLEAIGATQRPGRIDRPARSLKGSKAGRLVRVLLDRKAPMSVRFLAVEAGVDPGYVSRVLTYLAAEALVDRNPRGELVKVDWEKLLRRWAQESPFGKRGQLVSFIEPRGITGLMERLKTESCRYAVSGSMAASQWAPVAPTRLLTVYTKDMYEFADKHGLRPTEVGANVILIRPIDDYVFTGAKQRDGISYAAISQVAADLLTSAGRGPAEGEELVAWMRTHEEAWRG